MTSLMRFVHVMILFLMNFVIFSSQASLIFFVGGKHGRWAVKPSKNYDHWSQINRFQLNDSLIFRYKKGHDSVLPVDESDYLTCNKTKPLMSLDNQAHYSKFTFDHSGPFFFISGRAHHCEKGQKIRIVVMAPRPTYTRTAPSPVPSPFPVAGSTPTTPAPSPSPLPNSPSPSPAGIRSDKATSAAPAFGGGGSVKLLFCVLSTGVVLGGFNLLVIN